MLILLKVSFAIAMRLLISVLHFSADVIMKPRYLNWFVCLMFSPLALILHDGICCFFEITMHSVFFAFSSSPLA